MSFKSLQKPSKAMLLEAHSPFEDAAVAGASSLTFPNLGYLYAEGLVSSVDGYVPRI